MKFLVECSERHSRRQYVKRSQVPEAVSNPADSCRQMASLRRKHIDSKAGTQYITKNLSKTYSSSSVVSATSTKRSIVQQSRYSNIYAYKEKSTTHIRQILDSYRRFIDLIIVCACLNLILFNNILSIKKKE